MSMTESEALALATHRHYKGGLYRYIGTARHSETEESMVVYEHLWPHARGLWVRPADLFFGQLADGSARFAALHPAE
ncbi:hypothetical protein LMG26689_05396 [Achromobacter animicus]|uniref:DUF1653 domain-containing protein n=2 Tax=Achromobacter TaxID=222 RepID=A0A6S7AJN5_9BURK|nr:hypothetical protein LMG26690_05209 [Achromobacter animicus]CAB3918235.1 hypothetical protein LMG26689_05396 [Achromobacter animicus]